MTDQYKHKPKHRKPVLEIRDTVLYQWLEERLSEPPKFLPSVWNLMNQTPPWEPIVKNEEGE